MNDYGTFPFGQPVRKVEQRDRTKKKVFVLGVYASAVHARWIGPDGRTLMRAVGVASEPEIFWRGCGADTIVSAIEIPEGAGRLVPAADALSGPSGVALDERFLKPLGLTRKDAWLCDLVPHSCMNGRQKSALATAYRKREKSLGLPVFDWLPVPRVLADEARRAQIEDEIAQAEPEILIPLGDQPLRWFGQLHGTKRTLRGYGVDPGEYGRVHPLKVNGRAMGLLPLVHPRQAGRLGRHSAVWAGLHERWTETRARFVL